VRGLFAANTQRCVKERSWRWKHSIARTNEPLPRENSNARQPIRYDDGDFESKHVRDEYSSGFQTSFVTPPRWTRITASNSAPNTAIHATPKVRLFCGAATRPIRRPPASRHRRRNGRNVSEFEGREPSAVVAAEIAIVLPPAQVICVPAAGEAGRAGVQGREHDAPAATNQCNAAALKR